MCFETILNLRNRNRNTERGEKPQAFFVSASDSSNSSSAADRFKVREKFHAHLQILTRFNSSADGFSLLAPTYNKTVISKA